MCLWLVSFMLLLRPQFVPDDNSSRIAHGKGYNKGGRQSRGADFVLQDQDVESPAISAATSFISYESEFDNAFGDNGCRHVDARSVLMPIMQLAWCALICGALPYVLLDTL